MAEDGEIDCGKGIVPFDKIDGSKVLLVSAPIDRVATSPKPEDEKVFAVEEHL